MPLLFFYILLLFYATASSAPQQLSAQQLVDSSEFLIYEDMDLVAAKKLNKKHDNSLKHKTT